MKLLVPFLLLAFAFGLLQAQPTSSQTGEEEKRLVTVVDAQPLDMESQRIWEVLTKRNDGTKALVIISKNGQVETQMFIAISKPCQCYPDHPNRYSFLSDDQKRMVIELADSDVQLRADHFSDDIPLSVVKKMSLEYVANASTK